MLEVAMLSDTGDTEVCHQGPPVLQRQTTNPKPYRTGTVCTPENLREDSVLLMGALISRVD